MKVLVSDALSDKGIEVLRSGGLAVDVKTKLSPEELIRCIGDYDGLVVRSATKVTPAVIAAAGKLRVIGRAGSGLDNIDLEAATQRGIVVMNTPGGNTITTAEHTVAMLLSMVRRIPQATASVRGGKWEKNRFMGMELYNKVLGVVGMGQIGTHVARSAQGLSMQVIAYDPYLSPERARKMGVEPVTLEELFRRSDIITVHVPLTPETTNLIDRRSFDKMKPGVWIINCARGGIVSEQDLYEALTSGKVAGAALDVFEKEPADSKNPLLSLDNVIFTPHIGAATAEAQENVATAVAEQIVDFLIRGIVRNAANIPAIPADQLPKLSPYRVLTEKLGGFAAQAHEGGFELVVIEYQGEVSDLSVAPLTVAAMKGLLGPILEAPVNEVNAPTIAKSRGIEVKEVRSTDSGEFTSLVVLRIQGGGRVTEVAGTLYNRKDPRIVNINGMEMEVVPEGFMLMMTNDDQPGVIGRIGTLLGQSGVNISRMQLGRERAGGRAISVVGIDAPVSPELLAQLKKLPHILSAKIIKL
jgi:D-3-phosphoglycerate dehydrogenase